MQKNVPIRAIRRISTFLRRFVSENAVNLFVYTHPTTPLHIRNEIEYE